MCADEGGRTRMGGRRCARTSDRTPMAGPPHTADVILFSRVTPDVIPQHVGTGFLRDDHPTGDINTGHMATGPGPRPLEHKQRLILVRYLYNLAYAARRSYIWMGS